MPSHECHNKKINLGFYIYKILIEKSDYSKRLTSKEIIDILSQEYGITVDRRTVYTRIKDLTTMFPSIKKGEIGGYYYDSYDDRLSYNYADDTVLAVSTFNDSYIYEANEEIMCFINKTDGNINSKKMVKVDDYIYSYTPEQYNSIIRITDIIFSLMKYIKEDKCIKFKYDAPNELLVHSKSKYEEDIIFKPMYILNIHTNFYIVGNSLYGEPAYDIMRMYDIEGANEKYYDLEKLEYDYEPDKINDITVELEPLNKHAYKKLEKFYDITDSYNKGNRYKITFDKDILLEFIYSNIFEFKVISPDDIKEIVLDKLKKLINQYE